MKITAKNVSGITSKNSVRNTVFASALALLMGGASMVATSSVYAVDGRTSTDRYTVYGQVVDVQPVYQNIRVRDARQECWIEYQQRPVSHNNRPQSGYYDRPHRSSNGSAVVGGLIGGVIGNQLARGNGRGARTGATIAGAIIGSAVANGSRGNVQRHRNVQRHSYGNNISYQTVEVERCREVAPSRTERRIQYYDVTYEYRGRTYTTQTQQDPGDRIPLDITVSPSRIRR